MAEPQKPFGEQPDWVTRLLLAGVAIAAATFWAGLICVFAL